MDFLINWLCLHPFHWADVFTVLVLIIMEGLLSCDNAVVLALVVKDLPKNQQGRALRYGILGAYTFRIIAIALATYVLSIWWLKVAGGCYLAYLAIDFFRSYKDEDHDEHADAKPVRKILWFNAFVSTVIAVELTDIVFSVDSIAAAVALSSKVWVLIAGGFLGIIAMRFAAQGFIKLLEKFPKLEICAFAAVGFIGLKLIAETPLDVIRGTVDVAPIYADAKGYEEEASKGLKAFLAIPHVLTITSAVPAGPDAKLITDSKQLAKAKAYWNLECRPTVHMDGLISSLIVILIFASGFLKPARKQAEPVAQAA